MPVRKNRPVLYEVVRHGERPNATESRPAEPVRRQDLPAQPKPTPPESPPPSIPSSRARLVRIVDGRVQVNLGWAAGAVIGVGALLILMVVFQAGARYVQPLDEGAIGTQSDPILDPLIAAEQDRSSAARPVAARDVAAAQPGTDPSQSTGQPSQLSGPGGQTETSKSPPFEPRAGYHYVVVQHFQRSRARHASAAAEFLRSRGVDCRIVRKQKDIELVATTPFLLKQDDATARGREQQRCARLKKQIMDLGKEYWTMAGYSFDKCYERLH